MPDQPSENMTFEEGLSVRRGPVILTAGVFGLMLAGTLALWAHYGTTVFFETIRAGFMACFG